MTPAEHFGRSLPCWTEPLCLHKGKAYKGRRCCAKIDAHFREMEAELYNLWLAEGLVNQARLNFPYAFVDSREGFYGCPIQIDRRGRRVEPDDRIKGAVARASLFMVYFYHVELAKSSVNYLKLGIINFRRMTGKKSGVEGWLNRKGTLIPILNGMVRSFLK